MLSVSNTYDVAFIIFNKGTAIPFASRCAKALAFVAPHALRRVINLAGSKPIYALCEPPWHL
eukprot:5832917-Pleurochrysis_carterae.AAC.1